MSLHRHKLEGVHSKEFVDVQLDRDHVVFHGSEQEAIGVYLSGNLVFRLKEATAIKHIQLSLCGVRRVTLPTRAAGFKRPSRETEFYKHSWEFHDANRTAPEVFPAGDYKYPFNIILEGSMPESLEGLKDASITYGFAVDIGRKHGRNLSYRKPLRVIRAPKPEIVDLTLDEVWAQKIAYRVEMPSKVVGFGTSIDVNYDFVPILPGLKVAHIESQLTETRDFTLNEDALISGRNNSSTTTVLASDRYEVDESTPHYSTKSTDGLQFSRSMQLPHCLGQCVQDTSTLGIEIKHKLKIHVRMQNPDGHFSELRLSIPVFIYLSPHYRVWEGGAFSGAAAPPVFVENELSDEAPPPYGQHDMDRAFDEQGQVAAL
ncbi:hypothetical protein BJY01DRAFT_225833 [Aspergillus pseudoustus]|uniref:Arrestin C-terminal-like domain-containing protein n=1 Tax=Aspergillus pseudoustus TaxID=1810923 RepID=A0ABR4IYD3_9EURO